jgi:Fe-S-cluster-containing dehydrogenase component/formate-dependent nitrite reductase membrane component NrfD
MRYGFIIDNRKCIGCHACTTACKSEHQVPIGVNRTWVKQVEKGTFPNTRRLFSVMRCNHCTSAPCVEICPVQALYKREDGIVDFDNRRCIGCKSCMQACPYDALYIDPETHTAAKCNYCAHRIDIGLEPACVNVCPEHAIISGDMENPETEIAELLARKTVTVRKAEKYTEPNLFYIDGDEVSLNPAMTDPSDAYLWNAQTRGVGHYAKHTEKLAFDEGNAVHAALRANGQEVAPGQPTSQKSVELLLRGGAEKARRAYDAPDKGVLWGWEVPGYVLTKAISAGVVLVPVFAMLFNLIGVSVLDWAIPSNNFFWWSIGLSLLFLSATGGLLVKDLDRPDRFLNVLLRPQWGSWLVRGGYSFTLYGGFLTLMAIGVWFEWSMLIVLTLAGTIVFGLLTAVYTAFLFAQAKGRDFWQSPTLALHMLIHSAMAGAATLLLINPLLGDVIGWEGFYSKFLLVSIGLNLLVVAAELLTTHPTDDARRTVEMIVKGRFSRKFWGGAILLGNVLPLVLLATVQFGGANPVLALVASVLALLGILFTEQIWVEAPQRISLV